MQQRLAGSEVRSVIVRAQTAIGQPLYNETLGVLIAPLSELGPFGRPKSSVSVFALGSQDESLEHVRDVELKAPVHCATLVTPRLVALGCGATHGLLTLPSAEHAAEPGAWNTACSLSYVKWHLGAIRGIALLHGHMIASGGHDGQVFICDLSDVGTSQFPRPLHSHNAGPEPILSVDSHPTERDLVSWTTRRGALQLFDVRQTSVVGTTPPGSALKLTTHAHHGHYAILGAETGLLQVVDTRMMLVCKTHRDRSFTDIRRISVDDDLCCCYGTGLRAYETRALLRGADSHEQCRVDAAVDETWDAVEWAPSRVAATTSTGFVKFFDLQQLVESAT